MVQKLNLGCGHQKISKLAGKNEEIVLETSHTRKCISKAISVGADISDSPWGHKNYLINKRLIHSKFTFLIAPTLLI